MEDLSMLEEQIKEREGQFTVILEPMSPQDQPVIITRPEFMRRMKDMAALGGGNNFMMGNMPEQFNLVINSNHPLITKAMFVIEKWCCGEPC